MQTFILHSLDRIAKYSKELDAKAILYNKNWEIFNESGDKEVFIFRPKEELLIVKNGVVTKSKWELLPTGSLLITTDSIIYLFNAAFVDTNTLAFQLDGTEKCMILIESETKRTLALNNLEKINGYFENLNKEEEAIKNSNSDEKIDSDGNDGITGLIVMMIIFLLIIFAIFLASYNS